VREAEVSNYVPVINITGMVKIKDEYEHWQNGIYKRKPRCKGVENAEYLKWDHRHNDVEAYSKGQMHLGSINPNTLKLYKPPVIPRAML